MRIAEHNTKFEKDRNELKEKYRKEKKSREQKVRDKLKVKDIKELLPTFQNLKNSSDPDGKIWEKVLVNMKQPGGILGLEEEKRLEIERKKEAAKNLKDFSKSIKKPKVDTVK